MTFKLETIPLRRVPAGGIFIAENKDISMSFNAGTFDVYVKTLNIFYKNLEAFNRLQDPMSSDFTTSNHDAQVAYTGIDLPFRKIPHPVWFDDEYAAVEYQTKVVDDFMDALRHQLLY